jgi:23S rRNA pseudouridine2604 synthase
MEGISINKYIADTGFCSRRDAEKYIEDARVTINGNIALKTNRVHEGDIVCLDDEPIKTNKKTIYIAFNKPKGITCTTDKKDKTNIIDFINFSSRIFPIGRLDKLSEGLIFLTNDGDIVNKILRAGNGHEKEYMVTVDKPITDAFVTKMRAGVKIQDGFTKKCFVKKEAEYKFRIILTQGMNRQIRKMCEALGYRVKVLRRVRIMNITILNIPIGKWRYFNAAEVVQIKQLIQLSSNDASVDGMGE